MTEILKNDFNLCPMCGSKKIAWKDNKKWICSDCGFDLYCNVAAAVGVVIYDRQDNVLFKVRAKEPRKGFAALPGGFVDLNERAEDAAVRECREELGAKISGIKFICTFPNTYEYKNITYKTCDMFFSAELGEQYDSIADFVKQLKKQETEVQDFAIYKVSSEADLEKIPFAFESAKKTLLEWIKIR